MTKLLLPVFIFGCLALAQGSGRAADAEHATAYTALRSMAKSLGGDALNRVVEVTGRGGMPQPAAWRIIISEGAQGTREVKVAGAKIVAQKTSSRPTSLKTIQLTDLNLDSSGAFEAANEQARKTKVAFTALDYSLRVSDSTGKPVWDLTLSNDAGTHVGGVRLAAHDGKMLAVSGFVQNAPSTARPLVSTSTDHDSVQPTRVSPSRNTTTTTTTYTTVRPVSSPANADDARRDPAANPSSEGGFFSRAGRTLDHTTDTVSDTLNRTGHTVDRTVRQTGAKLQRFFTGHEQDN